MIKIRAIEIVLTGCRQIVHAIVAATASVVDDGRRRGVRAVHGHPVGRAVRLGDERHAVEGVLVFAVVVADVVAVEEAGRAAARGPREVRRPATIAERAALALGAAGAVGGCVRDGLLGLPAKDIDMEVYGLTIEEVESALKPHFRLDTVGRSFGVLIVKGENIDIALPRRESKTGPKHTDFNFTRDEWDCRGI